MNNAEPITAERRAELDSIRAQKIANSKILRKGVQSPIPFGIMDILFYDKNTKKTTRWTGNEEPETGSIIMLLPCRTERDLSRYASYTIPNEWKMKFTQGQQVYPVVNAEGYISKLIPATSMGTTNAFVTTKQVLANAQAEASKAFDVETTAEEISAEAEKAPAGPTADGFEESDSNPF